MAESITIRRVEGTADLYHKYPGQTNPQDCFLEMDPDDEKQLSCDYNPEVGSAVPMAVWHGRILRFTIPCLRAKYANELMERVAPLAKKLIKSYDCVWDGNNHVGRWNPELSEEFDELMRRECEDPYDYDTVQVWDSGESGDYYTDASNEELGLRADMDDYDVEALASKLDKEAIADGEVDWLEGTCNVLLDRRNSMRQELEEE